MKFQPGDDVVVTVKDQEHRGEVIAHNTGYVMCRIIADPAWDYGRTTWLDPEPTVCVKESKVRRNNC